MKLEWHLFMGGSKDGERYHASDTNQTIRTNEENYIPMRLIGDNKTPFIIYVIEGMEINEVLDRLIKNYNIK